MSKRIIIIINKGWAKALDKSIEKWEKQASDITKRAGSCPLCLLDSEVCNRNPDREDCESCPIYVDTGAAGCNRTSYPMWDAAWKDFLNLGEGANGTRRMASVKGKLRYQANEMLDYLKDLKSRCKVLPGIKQNRVKEELK